MGVGISFWVGIGRFRADIRSGRHLGLRQGEPTQTNRDY